MPAWRIIETARALAQGAVTSARLVEEALERADDPAGEGARVFTRIYREAARAQATASDNLRAAGIVASPLSGIPISIKDLFDVAGETTTAGSVVLKGRAPAIRDAAIVRRLRAAGAVIVGKTNMTEFAYSAVGLNPHYGTPRNCWDRRSARIPGGSSSGAAISVTDAMAVGAIGTDTGGSVRMPAALNGLVGFKPTARRVPLDGAFPLSSSLDSIGPLANSVACCAMVDAVIVGEEPTVPAPIPLRGLRLAVPEHYVIDGLEPAVAQCFEAALRRLSDAGAQVIGVPFAELEELPSINAKGGFSAAESYSTLRKLIASDSERIDPRVLARIVRGAEISGPDYVDLVAARASLIARAAVVTAPFDAVAMPTVALTAPTIAALAADDEYLRINAAILRNPSLVNFLDRCALTLPCHEPGEAPVGLTLMGEHLGDRRLISIGLSCEALLRRE
jgi:aspartyl-tRNA(Asn)/glutamyl-tRNA(Gln) amidotransferase subunit A